LCVLIHVSAVSRVAVGLPAARATGAESICQATCNALSHLKKAFKLDRQGHRQQAIQQYKQALELKPDYAEALNNLGMVLQGEGHL
jgi:Tfp pilus assembly protein PilF